MLEYHFIVKGEAEPYAEVYGSHLGKDYAWEKVEAIVAMRDGVLLGIILYEIGGDVCTVFDYYVAESCRDCGIGRMMFFKLLDRLEESDAEEIQIYKNCVEGDGGKFLTEVLRFEYENKKNALARFLIKDVLSSPIIEKCKVRENEDIIPLSSYRSSDKIGKLEKGFEKCPWELDATDVFLNYDHEFSYFLEQNDEVAGFILVKQINGGLVQLSYLYVDEKVKLRLPELFKVAAQTVRGSLDENVEVTTYLYADGITELASKIVPNMTFKDIDRYYRYL